MKAVAGPAPCERVLRTLLAVMLAAAGACMAPARAEPGVAETGSSAAAAGRFYDWYLGALTANRDPLHDDPEGLSARVSAALIREIRKKLASPDGMEADYFIQAVDYVDDWVGHVAVEPARRDARSNVVVVVLGTRPITQQRLNVVLAKEGGAWKIRQVGTR